MTITSIREKISSVRQVAFIGEPERNLNLRVNETLDGKGRLLTFNVNERSVEVSEYSSMNIPAKEWKNIEKCRASYSDYWFHPDNGIGDQIRRDEFDGFGPTGHDPENDPREVRHYRGVIYDATGQPIMAATMRKGWGRPNNNSDEPKWAEDITNWTLVNKNNPNEDKLLSDAITEFVGGIDQTLKPEVVVADIARTGHFNYQEGPKRESVGIIFAGINYLATEVSSDNPRHELYVCQLNEVFRDRILSISLSDRIVKPNFVKTEKTLGMDEGWETRLRLNHPNVMLLRNHCGGYWWDNESANELFEELIDSNLLTARDLDRAYQEAVCYNHDEINLRVNPTAQEMRKYLFKAKNIRFFVPEVNAEGPIAEGAKITGLELRQMIKDRVKPGPYSSSIKGDVWRDSALELIDAAHFKYNRQHKI